jgi:hypothetical protein
MLTRNPIELFRQSRPAKYRRPAFMLALGFRPLQDPVVREYHGSMQRRKHELQKALLECILHLRIVLGGWWTAATRWINGGHTVHIEAPELE